MFEYVISGLGYTRILLPAYRDNEVLVGAANTLIAERNNREGAVKLSALFNGLVETNSGKQLKKYHAFNNIFVDSGGLQAITRGMSIDGPLKTGVYKNQAEYGTVGMCFDEIPLTVVDDGSGSNKKNRTSLGNKVFQRSEVKPKAIKTASNIAEQLQYFKDSGTVCKAMAIMQGNCVETLVEYIETIFDNIPSNLVDGVHGIALADTCLGNGVKETVQLCLALEKAQIDPKFKKNIHLLGVGSLRRMLPVLMLSNNLFKDKMISFDSTSHSMSWMFGKLHVDNGRIIELGRTITNQNYKAFSEIYHDYIERFLSDNHLPEKDIFIKYVVDHITTFSHLNTVDDLQQSVNLAAFVYCLRAVDLFCTAIEEISTKPAAAYRYIRNDHHIVGLISSLTAVNNADDFSNWFAENESSLNSKSIVSDTNNVKSSLDEYFA